MEGSRETERMGTCAEFRNVFIGGTMNFQPVIMYDTVQQLVNELTERTKKDHGFLSNT